MNPFEYMQSLAEMWGRSGKEFAAAQQTMLSDMAGRMGQAGGKDGAPNLFDPQGMVQANEAFGKMWAAANELSQGFARNLRQGEAQDPLVTEVLGKVFDPRAWFATTGGMDETLQKMAEGPRLADMWNTERKMLAVFNAWTALRRRSLEHNTVMLEAWMRAAEKFARDLNARADKKEVFSSWRDLLALWVETANTALLETQRSEAYLQSQREILKASTDLRLAQQELAAFYSEMFGYPTRAELDDVHRTVTELRRELRAAQRASRAAAKAKTTPEKAAEVRS